MTRTMEKWALPLILGFYLLLGFSYSIINPVLESPDELLNYENIRFMVENRNLPVLRAGEFSKAHHPPLYYVMGATIAGWVPNQNLDSLSGSINPFWGYRIYEQGNDNKSQYLLNPSLARWPYRDAVLGIHLLRWVSLLLGAGVVAVVYFSSRAMFAGEPALAWGAAAMVAFNPMFLFIQTSVHNDALTNLLAALTVFAIIRYWNLGPSVSRAAILGLLAGFGILTKITFLFLGPSVAVAMIVRSWVDRKTDLIWWRTAIKMLTVGAVFVFFIAGWWFVRNQLLYGDPTSMRLQASIWQPREHSPDWLAAVNELSFLRDSFWGAFGFGQIQLHRPVYTFLWIMELMAVGGLVIWSVRSRKAQKIYRVSALLISVLLVLPVTAFLATFSRMTVSGSANFGRYLFTSYAVIAPLLVLGLTEWLRPQWRRAFLAGLAVLLFCLAVYGLVGVLRPAYVLPSIYADQEEVEINNPREDVYPGLARLLGFEISPESAVPGDRFDVTLIWQVLGETEANNTLFVQLVDSDGDRITGRDTHPGLGRYPTNRWQEGEIIRDTIPLYVPVDADGPQGLSLNVGLRDENGLLLLSQNGLDTLTLATVRLAAGAQSVQGDTPAQYYLGDKVELIDIEAPEAVVHPGDEISFSFTWRVSDALDIDYAVFVHLINENGEQVATFDRTPAGGSFPTHLWRTGDVVMDVHAIELPDNLPPGKYEMRIGWYRLDDLSRLAVVDDEANSVPESSIPVFLLEVSN